MRVAIASRIFNPEPSAASFRLAALATGFARSGDRVRVLTVKPVGSTAGTGTGTEDPSYRVTRFPVLRDRSGYVRGYLQYLSFDIPLFFRILLGPKQDAIIVEPPPTTVLVATLAAAIRRTPVFAYAADVWSDASASTGAPGLVVGVVRRMERFAWNRARGVFSVNAGVTARVREIAPRAVVETVGNGIDTDVFTPTAGTDDAESTPRHPYAIYTGTASEWQGAEIFVRAIAQLQESGTPLTLVFLGQGTAIPSLKLLAQELGADVEFHDPVPPAQAAVWQRGAAVSVASIKPGAGYDFAYPTKIFAAWACGTPVVYAGPGPARDVLAATPQLGAGVDFDATHVAAALREIAFDRPNARPEIAAWARANVSLSGVAARATSFTRERLGQATRSPSDRATTRIAPKTKGLAKLKAQLFSWLTLAKLRARGVSSPPVAKIEPHDGTLFVGPVNSAGQGHAWAHAAATRGVSMSFTHDSGFAFDIDQRVLSSYAAHSRGWQKRQLAAVSRARAALLESAVPPFSTLWGGDTLRQVRALQRAGVKVALLFHGSDIRDPDRHMSHEPLSHFREEPDFARVFRGVTTQNRELALAAGVPVFVSTPDLLDEVPGARWLPVVVDADRWKRTESPIVPGRPLRVAHAPSSSTVKGTDLIEPMLLELHRRGVIEYRAVSGVPHHEMPEIYGAADVVIDQFRVGNYGVAACEALAAGRIVVSHVSDRVRELTREHTGEELPVIEATPATLEAVLMEIVADPDAYREIASHGPGFVRRHHDGARSGQILLEWMERTAAPTEESAR